MNKTVTKLGLALLVLSLILAFGLKRQTLLAQTQTVKDAASTRAELPAQDVLTRQVRAHRLFKPRGAFFDKRAQKAEWQSPVEPLPRAWPAEAKQEKIDRLVERWEKRPEPAEYQAQTAQLAVVPEEPAAAERVDQLEAAQASQALGSTTWTQLGSGIRDNSRIHHKAGRVRAAAYAYDNEQGLTTLWLGASSGGLWKFSATRAAWTPVSQNLAGSPSVGAFLIMPGDSRKILIGTGDYYRYGGSGLYRTTDGGATWTIASMSPTPSSFFKIILDRGDAGNRTVLACADNGIWRSTDAGETWTRIYAGATTDLAQDPAYPSYWYAGAPGLGALESSDAGRSFHSLGRGITGPIGRISLTVCTSAPNYVYALIEGEFGSLNNIYRSSDYGANWRAIDTVDRITWGQAFHTCAIGVDPTDPNRLYVGMGGLQRTENATEATPVWTEVEGGHADFTSFLFVPGTSTVIITNDGGYYAHDYAENTISGAGNLLGLNIGQAGSLASARTEPGLLLSGLQDNGMVRVKGREARFLGGGDGGYASISPDNANLFAFSSGVAFHRYFSADRGTTWAGANCPLGNEWGATMLIDPTPGVTPYFFTNTDRHVWYKPVSSACDWRQVNGGRPLPEGFGAKQVDSSNDSGAFVFYMTGWGKSTLYVMDGSVHGSLGNMNWADRTPSLPVGSTRNDANVTADRSSLQPRSVYYTTGGARPSRAFLSANRGLNWRDVTGDLATILPDANYWELIANPRNLNQLFLTTNMGVFRSDNGGVNWYRFMEGLPRIVEVGAIELNAEGTSPATLHISTYGRGFWERQLD